SLRHAPPYHAARRLLALAGVTDASALTPGQAREALRAYFAAQTTDGPLVIVLDELQHADIASVQVLESALAAARDCPVLLLGRDPLPDTVVGHVQAWFDGFGPDLKRVLRAASLLDEFEDEALIALVGDKHRRDLEGWLQLLVDRGVLERASEAHHVFRFRS